MPLVAYLGGQVTGTVGEGETISKLTLIRAGSATHSYNSDQRFINLPFTQNGTNISAAISSDSTIVIPGYYMLFAFNSSGVPSIASMVRVLQKPASTSGAIVTPAATHTLP